MSSKNHNESGENSMNEAKSSPAPETATRKKAASKKAAKTSGRQHVNNSYEHHLEKWLENTSNFNNFDPSFMTAFQQQQPTNRKGGNHPHLYGLNDPISLPSNINSFDGSASIAGFMNFNTNFKQQYPHLLQRQQSQSPISNDPLTSISSQQEFLSLPTAANEKTLSTDQEKLNDVISQTRRFNNLLIDDTPNNIMNASKNSTRANDSSAEDDLDDDDDNEQEKKQQNGSDVNNKTLLVTLMKQINLLHETNSKIFRNLHETKVEMEALKYAPTWGLRHRRDSVSGLSVHSQPFGYGGIASPAPTYHSQGGSNYPGVVTDLIREVRDAGRVRDESLMNRVKNMIDEKSWSLNESNMRVSRELEETKIQVHNLKMDRQLTNDRLNKLEDEVRSIRTFLGASGNPFQQFPQFPNASNSNLAMNDQLKRSNMSLNYNVSSTAEDGNFSRRYSQPMTPKQRHENELDDEPYDVMQLEKDTFKLRRDLQDAIASKKQAENRILALEHMVTSLKTPTNTNHHPNNQANITSMPSEFLQPQQHQLQIQINGGDGGKRRAEQHVSKPLVNQTTGKLMSPKASTAKASQVMMSSASGPVTDL